jgi:hypothetical protein
VRALLFLMLVPILWLMLAPANRSYSQNPPERSIEKPIQHKEPVEMEDIQVQDDQGLKSVKPSAKFRGNEDWLKGLTLRLKNTSGKSIVYVEVRVYVPTSDTEDKPVAFSLRYGVIPRSGSDNLGFSTSPPITHGRSVTLRLSDDDYELGKNIVREKRGNVNFNHVEIRVGMIVFDDGTAWKNGYSLRRDPNDPERWVQWMSQTLLWLCAVGLTEAKLRLIGHRHYQKLLNWHRISLTMFAPITRMIRPVAYVISPRPNPPVPAYTITVVCIINVMLRLTLTFLAKEVKPG